MYKFTGGFLNTLTPYDDEIINRKLIVTKTYEDIVSRLLSNFKLLLEPSNKKTIIDYVNKDIVSTLIKEIIDNLENINLYTSELNKLPAKPIAVDKFIKHINTINIPQLTTLKKKIENLLKINCFYDNPNPNSNCDIINKEETHSKTENLLINIKNYIGDTFGLYQYDNKFKDMNITKYILLQKFFNDEKYYVLLKTTIPEDPECRFFILQNNLSINELKRETIIDKISYTPSDERIYFLNTNNNNLSRGKMYSFEFIEAINQIIKEKVSDIYIDLKYITDLFDILYVRNRENNQYMIDVIKKYNNIVIFLVYINKIKIIYDAIDNNTVPIPELFEDIKDHISYSYNYYLYLSNLMSINTSKDKIDESLKIINDYLKKTKEEVYNEFIDNVKKLYTILNNLKIICDDNGTLAKDIISNFLNRLFETNNLSFPVNKEKIVTTLTETEPVRRKINDELFIDDLSFDDKIFNYTSIFKIVREYTINYEEYSFTNCGENTLFNLINYLLVHNFVEHQKIFKFNEEININKLLTIDKRETTLYQFYKQFTNFSDLIYKYENNSQIRNNFAEIFYKLPIESDIYNTDRVCEIKPSEENIVKILNNVLERNFQNITEFIKFFDENHEVTIDNNNKILNKKYILNLTKVHGSFEPINDIKYTSLYKLLYKEITELDRPLIYKNNLILYSKIYNDNNGNTLLHDILNNLKFNDVNKIHFFNSIDKRYLNIQNIFGNTIAHMALNENLLDIVDKLIDIGINVNVKNNDGITLLQKAMERNLPELCIKLIEKGADVNVKDDDGITLLQIAMERNLPELCIKLIEKGADVNVKDKYGSTLLQKAMERNLPELCIKLIEKGADVNVKVRKGIPLLQIAHETIFFDKLIEKGADINVINVHGNSLLYEMYRRGDINNFFKLVNYGVNLNTIFDDEPFLIYIIKLKQRRTQNDDLFYYDLFFNNYDFDEFFDHFINNLKKYKIDLNIQNADQYTPLHYAFLYKLYDIAEKLIDNGANGNIQNKSGDTPLHMAVYLKLYNLINKLIDNGADVTIKNINDKSPLDIAIERNLSEIIEKMKQSILPTTKTGGYINYYVKYLKYKHKYLQLKKITK
jgi:ankyrin repeat protein